MIRQIDLKEFDRQISKIQPYSLRGKVHQIVGTIVEGYLPGAQLGTLCDIIGIDRQTRIMSEVVGFNGDRVLLAPYGSLNGVSSHCSIEQTGTGHLINVGEELLGRVLDGLGNPLDGRPLPPGLDSFPLFNDPPNPVQKKTIKDKLDLGIRSINSLFTVGKGQRIALMAGSGVGKSVLMGMTARNVKADINVIALIGERGREVNEFIETKLGPEGLAKSILIVVSSDKNPLVRIRGANFATAVAEYFRLKGKDVLFVMDSITRYAHALREIGIATGEPPTTKGYTPSVFSALPKLLERVGTGEGKGSITGIYTVLVDQDDFNDPVADAVRGTLDGHIVLSRNLATRGIFPAIDIKSSLSRIMVDIVDKDHWRRAQKIKEQYSVYEEAKTLIEIGAYQKGSNPSIDEAIENRDAVINLLKQDLNLACNMDQSLASLHDLSNVNQQQVQNSNMG